MFWLFRGIYAATLIFILNGLVALMSCQRSCQCPIRMDSNWNLCCNVIHREIYVVFAGGLAIGLLIGFGLSLSIFRYRQL
jgi:hypothetical protein